jgi:site-specific recombinase XerD
MQTLEVSFFIRSDKTNNEGLAPVYCRIRINKSQRTFATGFKAEPEKWKKLKQYRNTRNEEYETIRGGINKLKKIISDAFEKAQKNNLFLTADELRNEALNPGTINLKKEHTLLEAFDRHYTDFKTKVEAGSRSEGTLSKFQTTKNHIVNFLRARYNVKDFPLNNLNFEFIDAFHWHLKKKCSHNYSVRRCEFLKSVVKLTRKLEWMEKDPFMLYSEKRKEIQTIYLTKDELKKLSNVVLKSDKHEVIRDLFFFTVFTGYAGIDVLKLTPDNVVKHTDGKHWIFTNRQKTDIESNVPLLEPARAIIKKYKNYQYCQVNNKLLPKRSNQKINKYLKEIAELAGIKKRLTYYVARHTFATTICIANGLSIEALSKMLGHKRISQTQHYGRIMNERVSDEMKTLDKKRHLF